MLEIKLYSECYHAIAPAPSLCGSSIGVMAKREVTVTGDTRNKLESSISLLQKLEWIWNYEVEVPTQKFDFGKLLGIYFERTNNWHLSKGSSPYAFGADKIAFSWESGNLIKLVTLAIKMFTT
jgi:hypothetical protein